MSHGLLGLVRYRITISMLNNSKSRELEEFYRNKSFQGTSNVKIELVQIPCELLQTCLIEYFSAPQFSWNWPTSQDPNQFQIPLIEYFPSVKLI